MADTDTTAPRPDIPYEQARDELIEVVRKLETGGTTLEESLTLWERGEHLAAVCEQWLEGAKARLQKAVQASAGSDSGTDSGTGPDTGPDDE